jgi:sugar-specific transcriptional regulator TrmB
MPVTPSEISGKLISEIEGTFAKLESVKDILSERGIPQLVYTIMGKDRVLDKIGEMLDKSQSNFVISSPSFAEIRKSLGKKFPSAISRGVSVSVITSPFIKAPSAVRVIRRKGLIATDVISDGSTALLAASDLSACGYTDNEVLASHLEEFLRIMSESRD